jgi:hypothetical protein
LCKTFALADQLLDTLPHGRVQAGDGAVLAEFVWIERA